MTFNDIIILYQKRINNILMHFINDINLKDSILFNAIKYSTLSCGKRLRPLLVYATGNMLKANFIDLDVPAAAIELIHTYSLIHDDLPIMDNDNLRRGRPSCHIKFGENIAMLSGNALQALAFSILSTKPMHNVTLKNRLLMVSILAKAIGTSGICRGQELDLMLDSKNLNILEEMYQYKTGSLIQAAIQLGMITAGYNIYDNKYNLKTALYKYALSISIAFQIKNDILDIIGNVKKTGKNQGSDKKLKKNTYPQIIGIKKSKLRILFFYKKAIDSLKIIKTNSINIDMLQYLAQLLINLDT